VGLVIWGKAFEIWMHWAEESIVPLESAVVPDEHKITEMIRAESTPRFWGLFGVETPTSES
jgi:hypothetical protein